MQEKNIESIKMPEPAEKPKKKKRYFRKICKYFFLLVLLSLMGTGGAVYWICATESGQSWLMSSVNNLLKPAPDKDGAVTADMYFQLTGIRGSLPFNFHFGLEGYDAKGLWLKAPENYFELNWKELPASVHILALRMADVDLGRLPDLPPESAPSEPSKPFSIKELQALLADASDFLSQKHWWLPAIKLDSLSVENLLLPADSVAQKKKENRLRCDAASSLNFMDGRANASLSAEVKNASEEMIELDGANLQSLAFNAALQGGAAADGLDANIQTEININDPDLSGLEIPKDYLGEKIALKLGLESRFNSENHGVTLKIAGPNLDAGKISLQGAGDWESGKKWKEGDFSGPLAYELNFAADEAQIKNRESILAMLAAPLKLRIHLKGNLPKLDGLIDLACAKMEKDGHGLEDLNLSVTAQDVDLPLNKNDPDILQRENHINLGLSALVDKEKVDLATQAYFQAQGSEKESAEKSDTEKVSQISGWRFGLRDFTLNALGATAGGEINALLEDGQDPAVSGNIKLDAREWKAISRFIPGQRLAGKVAIDISLDNSRILSSSNSDPASGQHGRQEGSQDISVKIDVPAFSMRPDNGDRPFELAKINGKIDLADAFSGRLLDLNLAAGSIKAAGMDFGAKVKAQGPLSGPLQIEIEGSGAAKARISASWEPGKALLKTLDCLISLPGEGGAKPVSLGAQSAGQAEIRYGDGGIQAKNVDLRIIPSGRLKASGGFAPDKLDLSLNLENLDFRPWRKFSSQIPDGSLNLAVKLNGSPVRPAGSFRLAVNKVSIPQAGLPPVSLILDGGITNSGSDSALNMKLNLDQATLKNLGASAADISAKLPLKFNADGIPGINMQGPVSGRVKLEGAVGPIWNLAPLPDMRFNGRFGIDVNASGSLAQPRIRGGVRLSNGRFEYLTQGVLLSGINMKVDLTEAETLNLNKKDSLAGLPGGVVISLDASDGRGGYIKVNGKSSLTGENLDVKAVIDRLKPLHRRDAHVELSGVITTTGSATAPAINGEITVNQGEILLNNLALSGSVTTLNISDGKQPKKKPQTVASKSSQDGGSINLRIIILPRFTVEGRGLTSLWKANLLVEGSPFDPKITGNISSVRGNFDFLGKIFTLTKGVVFFGGGSLANPLLDIELTNETPDLTAHILVTGPVNKMKLTMTSDPSLPRDDILSRVLFGRSLNDLSRLEQLQLAAAVAELAGIGSGSNILNKAKKALGVDVLRLGSSSESGGDDEDGGGQTSGGATIEMGKYINDMIYMGVQQGLQPDSTAFIIQLELTPRTSLEIKTEKNNTWGGLNWKYNY